MSRLYKPAIRKDLEFQSIRDTCNSTGLSQHYLREGCKNGEIPHVMSGNTYMINVPMMLEKLQALSARCGK